MCPTYIQHLREEKVKEKAENGSSVVVRKYSPCLGFSIPRQKIFLGLPGRPKIAGVSLGSLGLHASDFREIFQICDSWLVPCSGCFLQRINDFPCPLFPAMVTTCQPGTPRWTPHHPPSSERLDPSCLEGQPVQSH